MDNRLKIIELAKKSGFSDEVIMAMEKDTEKSSEKPSKDEMVLEDKSTLESEDNLPEDGGCSMDEGKVPMSAQDMIRKAKQGGMTVVFMKK